MVIVETHDMIIIDALDAYFAFVGCVEDFADYLFFCRVCNSLFFTFAVLKQAQKVVFSSSDCCSIVSR